MRATVLQILVLRLRPALGLQTSSRPFSNTFINLCLCPSLFSRIHSLRRRHFLARLSLFGRTVLVLPTPIFYYLCSWARRLRFPTPVPSTSLGWPSIPSNPKRPDAHRLGSARHPQGEVEASLTFFPVLATASLPSVPRAAVSDQTTEPRHLLLETAAPVNAGPTAFHMHAQSDPYLAMMRPSDLRDSCNAVVWDERQRFDIGSHVNAMLHNAAGGLPHFAFRTGSNLNHRGFLARPFRQVATPCQMDTYLLRRDCGIDATRFASIPTKVDRSPRTAVGHERAWLDHWADMRRIMYEPPPDLDSKWMRCQNETGYPGRVLGIIERLRQTREPLSLGPYFVPFGRHYDRVFFFRDWAH